MQYIYEYIEEGRYSERWKGRKWKWKRKKEGDVKGKGEWSGGERVEKRGGRIKGKGEGG